METCNRIIEQFSATNRLILCNLCLNEEDAENRIKTWNRIIEKQDIKSIAFINNISDLQCIMKNNPSWPRKYRNNYDEEIQIMQDEFKLLYPRIIYFNKTTNLTDIRIQKFDDKYYGLNQDGSMNEKVTYKMSLYTDRDRTSEERDKAILDLANIIKKMLIKET